jgi:hypothetical protein
MQCRGGGWGAFEADNTQRYLNNIPFADHGALLDPPTADVSARCLSMLAQLQPGACIRPRTPAARALAWLLRQQEKDGSWYGRWGVNYIYGTWSALCALGAAGLGTDAAAVTRAAGWLGAIQNLDGDWGEDGSSYKLAYVETGLNLVDVEDVALGHLLALERGQVGERYILGADNLMLRALLDEIVELGGRRAPRVRLPVAPLVPLAHAAEALARLRGKEPFLTVDGLAMSRNRMFFSSSKARRELGYRPGPHKAAMEAALDWFGRAGYLN